MVSRFISKQVNSDLNYKAPKRLTKCQAMMRGRNAAIRDIELLRKRRKTSKN